jgi:hypothetical protein
VLISNEEKRSPNITELVAIIGLMVSILVAVTTLLGNSGNLPYWWYGFSFAFLIILMLSVPIMLFQRQLNERIRKNRIRTKQDSIARKYALEFREIVRGTWDFNNSIRSILDKLKNVYKNQIKGELSTYALESGYERIDSNQIINDIDNSQKTFGELCLINENFEALLNSYNRNLKVAEIFVHEIIATHEKIGATNERPIDKTIEADFEAFREKYNYFLNCLNTFNHNINKETGTFAFNEHHELIKKWQY